MTVPDLDTLAREARRRGTMTPENGENFDDYVECADCGNWHALGGCPKSAQRAEAVARAFKQQSG